MAKPQRSQDIQFDVSDEDLEELGDADSGLDETDDVYSDDDEFSISKPMEYHPLKLPQAQLDKMRAEYDVVVVQDFNDDYELSAEELRGRYQFYSVFERLRTMKAKFSNLPDYVYAFREAMKCLKAVAKENQVYSEEKFIKLVLNGDIKVSGLKFPRYNGSKNKKSINWERVMRYVIDESLDPNELIRKENEARFEIATEDSIQAVSDMYFNGNIYNEIASVYEHMEEDQRFVDFESDEELDGMNVVVPMSRKEEKHFIGIDRSALEGIRQFGIDRKVTGRQLKDFSFQIAERDFDDFARIEKIDDSRGDEYLGIPQFTGDISNDDDVARYLLALEEYELRHTRMEYKNKSISLEEYRELELKDLMEQSGWNVRTMYNYAQDEKKEKKKLAKMEKKRKKMRKRLMKLEELTGHSKVNGKKKKHDKSTKLKDAMHKGVEHALSDGYSSFESMQKAMESWGDDD